MRQLRFIDVTARDGQQALWGSRMTTEMLLPRLPDMDRMGFAAIDLVGGAVFGASMHHLGEDPWARMRLAQEQATETPLNVWTAGQSLFSSDLYPDDVVTLVVERCAANGMRRLTTYDGLNDIRNIELTVREAKSAGLEVSGHLVFAESPVHSDDYFEKKAREIIALGVDTLGINDPVGVLRPERVATLIPALKAVAGEVPLELHSHCRSGLGELVYLVAAPLGVDILHTAVRPLASGDSLPEARYVMRHLREEGFVIPIADADLEKMEEGFCALAEAHGFPVGRPQPFDPFLFHHQLPSGVISTLCAQLADMDMSERLDEVLEEAGQVRQDLGYPAPVGPFGRLIATQALLNIVEGERYGTIHDDVARTVLGLYGEVPGTIAPEVDERSRDLLADVEPVTERPGAHLLPRLAELKAEAGPFDSDDELALAALDQGGPVDRRHLPADAERNRFGTLLELVSSLPKRRGVYAVSHGGIDLECTR